ncbi:hypothetical protein B0J12DRAFT_141313 [Macrophomina phaseolina]|uniref:Myb-like domain-containing protein n=1 Tax=Macrophomina phaseolina TaxID=35725 RepID=A0ABQ8G8L0_9PEZI|nr:hypothetical protein B0J12DRAFT_141313 [Macrophomina phaseolina]
MAQHQRVRSRTPQQADAPRYRTNRTTRSQSRDIEQTRDTSVESTHSARGTYAYGSRDSRRTAGRNLSTVPEDADVTYPDLPGQDAEESHSARESVISGTTAISTAQTVHDPADLDAELMLDALDELCTDAGKILDIVAPNTASAERLASLVSEVTNPASRTSIVLEKREKRFRDARQYFGDAEFINRDTVLASFAGGPTPYISANLFRRPDAIIYKANIATFAIQIAAITHGQLRAYDILLSLDNTFPRNFLASLDEERVDLGHGSSALVKQTLEVALDIRTQFAISLLTKDQGETGFDPDATIQSVFFAMSDGENGMPEKAPLRGWEIEGFGMGDEDLPKLIRQTIAQRIADVRECFQGEEEALEHGDYVDLAKLNAKFPWSDFVTRTLSWIRLRNIELDNEITSLGGVSEIVSSLTEYHRTGEPEPLDTRGRSTSQNQGTTTMDANVESQTIPKTAPSVANLVGRYMARLSGQLTNVANEPVDEPDESDEANGAATGIVDDYQPPVLGDDDDDYDSRTFVNAPTERSTMQGDLEILQQREKQNKENMRRSPTNSTLPRRSVFDRQPGATRVPFDDPDILPTGDTASSSKSRDKRRRADSESDEDEEFETRIAQDRRKAPVRKQSRYTAPSMTPPSARGRSQTTRPSARNKEATPDLSDEEESSASHAQQLKTVSQQARASSYTAGASAARGRQPWNDEEVNTFLELVQKYAWETQPWKAIKEADAAGDNVLFHRTNVDLKDKAMNTIFLYKKSGHALPPGLEVFKLPKHLQAKLDRWRGTSP